MYNAWDSRVSRASSEISAESKSKKTWFPSIVDGTCVHAEKDASIKIKKYFFISYNLFSFCLYRQVSKFFRRVSIIVFLFGKVCVFVV